MANRPQFLIPKRAAEPSHTARTCRVVFNGPPGNWPASLTLTADHGGEKGPTLDVDQIEGVRVRVGPTKTPRVVVYIEGGLVHGVESDGPCTVYLVDAAEDVENEKHPRLVAVPTFSGARHDGRAYVSTFDAAVRPAHLDELQQVAEIADRQCEECTCEEFDAPEICPVHQHEEPRA